MPADSVLLPFLRGTAQYAVRKRRRPSARCQPNRRADDERLPGGEGEGLAGPLALAVPQEAEEVDRMLRRLHIEAQALDRTTAEIIQVALRRPGGPGGW